jgi:hypothetical protein
MVLEEIMSRENLQQVLGIILFIGVYFWLSSPGTPESPTDFTLTEEGIKTLDSDINTVRLAVSRNQIDIDIIKDPFTGGAQDWNSIANTTYRIGKKLLTKLEVKTVTLVWWSSGEKPIDWARVILDREKIPTNWEELTYLQYFSSLKKLPGTVEAGQWLCDFYAKYESARPNGIVPDFCKINP